jgi:hypothetical protein
LRAIWVAVTIFLFTVTAAKAESTKDALASFGILGTWSSDCTKDPTREPVGRSTYSAPLVGAATVEQVRGDPDGFSIVGWDIESAARVAEDKIRIVIAMRSLKHSEPKMKMVLDPEKHQIVIQKIGARTKTIDNRTSNASILVEGGLIRANHSPTPLLERCLN